MENTVPRNYSYTLSQSPFDGNITISTMNISKTNKKKWTMAEVNAEANSFKDRLSRKIGKGQMCVSLNFSNSLPRALPFQSIADKLDFDSMIAFERELGEDADIKIDDSVANITQFNICYYGER